jgi:leukotriene-A4 hydrolase
MKTFYSGVAFLIPAILFLNGCGNNPVKQTDTMKKAIDIHSYSKPFEVIINHISLDLKVNFTKKELSGKAELSITNHAASDELILDVRDLKIDSIILDDGAIASFTLSKPDTILGSGLSIKIKPGTRKLTIHYSTSPQAAALQWLEPSQTAGGIQPFLFTQSQAVLARTWIPLQDSPGVKFTYDARISCPPGLVAIMSAENDTSRHNDGVYTFKMPQPIPSYLMALAVGDITFHSYDKRCGVFAEPAIINEAAWEFEDLPKMISSAEELYGPYAWGRYDVLVLPPSFPFGGMENPRITFATPTIITGDRSLVALVAHELAHSWSGNLVTNATWNDFWLNEGFTVYFETRIMEKIYGKDYADMLTLLSLDELKGTIKEMGDKNRDTHLYLDLKDRDPDEGVSDIAYEKGRFFLTTIEHAVGREKWDAFVNKYFHEFAFKSMDTESFLEYLDKELIKGDKDLSNKINANAWVYGPGLPSNCPKIESAELQKAGDVAQAFKSGTPASSLDTSGWTTHHWMYFLRNLNDSLDLKKMEELDQVFNFTNTGNSEIASEWFQHAIASKYTKAYPALEKFLLKVGRRKFLKPIYSELAKTPEGLQMGREIYKKARPGYHAVSYQTIDGILKMQ